MADVLIYTTALCGFCYRAKRVLKKKGVAYTEIDVTFRPGKRAEMRERAGGLSTVPQIWIGGRHVGGSDELADLDRSGELDAMLEGAR